MEESGLDELIKGDGDKYLSVGEVARLLNIHPNTVRLWSDMGVLRTFRNSQQGHRKFWIEDIKTFLTRK